jgi:hypothetical protein
MQKKTAPETFESYYLQRARVPHHDRTWIPISLVVTTMHVLLLFLFSNVSNPPPIPKFKERLVVKTVSLNSTTTEILDSPLGEPIAEISPPTSSLLAPQPEPKPIAIEPVVPVVEAPTPEPEPIEVDPSKEQEKPTEIPKPEPKPEPVPEQKREPKPEPKLDSKPKQESKPKPKQEPPKKTTPKKKEPTFSAKKTEKKSNKSVEKVVTKKEDNKKSQPKKTPEPALAKKKETTPSKKSETKKKADPPKKERVINKETKKKSETKQAETTPLEPKIDPEVIAAQEAAKAKRRELLASAQKSIAKIERTHDKLGPSQTSLGTAPAVPRPIESLQIETILGEKKQQLTPQEIGYHEELASRLKLLLRLPEFGEVKIKLTLERSGRFVKVVIVSAESASNRKYIEKTLPALKFPSFGNNFNDLDQYTFVIALSNE